MASTVDAGRIAEVQEGSTAMASKIKRLAKWVRASKHTVFFTGAGVSTSAGVGDYRGPTGAWTMRRVRELERLKARGAISPKQQRELETLEQERERKGAQRSVPMIDAMPTPTHMAMSTLIRRGVAHYVVTTNLDGIHRKSGLKAHEQICNLHGCVYAERCTGCGYDFERNYHTRRPRIHVHDHHIGTCSKCGSKVPRSYTGHPTSRKTGSDSEGFVENHLVGTRDEKVGTKDTHINFGECLDDIDWNEAEEQCKKADLVIVAGTSMSLRHITHFPFMAIKTVIVNLQQTPDDHRCHLRIWGKTDPVFELLMSELKFEIDPVPAWRPRDSVPLHKIPKYIKPFYVEAAKRLRQTANRLEKQTRELEAKKQAETKKKREAEMSRLRSTSQKEAVDFIKSGISIGNRVSRAGNRNFKWTMFVKGQDEKNKPLSRFVENVTYHLHPTFTPRKVTVGKEENFELIRFGWGTFTIDATLNFKPTLCLLPVNVSHDLCFDIGTNGSITKVMVVTRKGNEIKESAHRASMEGTAMLCRS